MKVIFGGRKSGRTSLLIHQAALARSRGELYYIVCDKKQNADNIAQRAKELGLNISSPITFDEFLSFRYVGRHIDGLLIDNADHLLQSLTSIPIKIISLEREVDDDD